MKTLRLPLLLVAFLALGTFSLNAAQLATVKALGVTGTVTKYNDNGGNEPLVAGDILKAGDSISVTALSSAKLVFSNGSIIDVKENTSIEITEFIQDGFGGNQSYEQLEADPSKSQVLLELNYGELDGHVKKLQQGSKFDIQTPLGTAAIRGTQFTVKLSYNAERGEFLLVVKNKDGKVMIISRYAGKFEYDNTIGDKNYDFTISNESNESIPKTHTIIIRLHNRDPYFEGVFNRMRGFLPPEVRPPTDLPKVPTPEDPGIQIVSPNTPAQSNTPPPFNSDSTSK